MRPLRSLSVLASVVLLASASCVTDLAPATGATSVVATSPVSRVWVEPAAGMGFLQSALAQATRSVDISMYELSDPVIEEELVARAHAGVRVDVLLNAAYFGTSHNAASFAFLRQHGVSVRWASTSRIFHAKYVIVDARSAFIGSGNLVRADYPTTRDFWVADTSARDVVAMTATFNADFNHVASAPHPSAGLVWSPGSTSALVSLIASARHSVVVENEEMASTPIETALITAVRRGVNVVVVMTASSSWTKALVRLASAGVRVATLRPSQVYIHAKVIDVDPASTTARVFVGSENFSDTSLGRNRELGLVTSNSAVARTVATRIWNDVYAGVNVVVSPTVTTTTPASPRALAITSFDASVTPGQEDVLSVHSPRSGDTCDLEVVLPSGRASASQGLGAQRADPRGNLTWTWKIGTRTGAGVARATVTCGAGIVVRNFTVL